MTSRRSILRFHVGWRKSVTLGTAIATTALHAQAASNSVARRFRDVALSPDGKYLAWVGAPGSGATTSGPAALVVMDRARGLPSAGAIAVDGARPGSVRDLHWSRDGRTLVFLASDASDGVTGIYSM